MNYTLQDFCAEMHKILIAENNENGREKVRQKLEELLTNETFVEQFCGLNNSASWPWPRVCIGIFHVAKRRRWVPQGGDGYPHIQ